jgi:hypothetical protein
MNLNGKPFRYIFKIKKNHRERICRFPAGFFGLVGGPILWFLGDSVKAKFLKA